MGKKPKWGFKECVKNPDLFREEAREMERANALPPPGNDHLAALVAAMYTRELEYEELQLLRKAGKRVVRPLVAALRDPNFLFQRYGEGVLAGSPMDSALDLLEPFAEPPAAVLEPALRHKEEYFRSRALYHLARCGKDDAIAALEDGLASASERCRTSTLIGLQFLEKSGRGSKRFRRALFDAVLPLLHDKEYGCAKEAPRTLLALDRERAVKVLLGEEILRSDNPNVSSTLEALKDAWVPVPAARLRSLLAGIRNRAHRYPFDYAYANGLILLARAEGKAAADVIADARTWGKQWVKEAAAEATGIMAGVHDAYAVVLERLEREGVDGLSEPQLYYLTLTWLHWEVKNGGFTQYFFNSYSDLAGHAVDAAKAVGATKAARVIQKAMALFGPDGPDPNRDKRMDQLSTLNLKALEKLDFEYYACADDLWELLLLYVARHPDEFRSRNRGG
jgi:hypothetical protein